jgi:hypothetical protein
MSTTTKTTLKSFATSNVGNNRMQNEVNTSKSYFCQPVESDEKDDNGTANKNLLKYPEIHSYIFSFLSPKDVKTLSRINRATKTLFMVI